MANGQIIESNGQINRQIGQIIESNGQIIRRIGQIIAAIGQITPAQAMLFLLETWTWLKKNQYKKGEHE